MDSQERVGVNDGGLKPTLDELLEGDILLRTDLRGPSLAIFPPPAISASSRRSRDSRERRECVFGRREATRLGDEAASDSANNSVSLSRF